MTTPVFEVDGLEVRFRTGEGVARAVNGISFSVHPGERVAVVGESGCGKSASLLAALRLLPSPPAQVSGRVLLDGQDLFALSRRELNGVLGRDVAMVFQDSLSSLNPVLRMGRQISEGVRRHEGLSKKEARAYAVELLTRVGVPDPHQRVDQYPHQLSGGMRQRAMIAMALACRPVLLIADEPTTALDVTIQAQILALIVDLQKELGTGLILITHDLGVVAQTAQRVIVMYAGRKVEEASVDDLFAEPRHPYTRGLMASMPAVIALGAKTDTRLTEIPGMVPSLTNLPAGCAFAPRCRMAIDRCRVEHPPLEAFGENHLAACWRAAETGVPL
jgi:peptide/nickel transport system ATP-binding protein